MECYNCILCVLLNSTGLACMKYSLIDQLVYYFPVFNKMLHSITLNIFHIGFNCLYKLNVLTLPLCRLLFAYKSVNKTSSTVCVFKNNNCQCSRHVTAGTNAVYKLQC